MTGRVPSLLPRSIGVVGLILVLAAAGTAVAQDVNVILEAQDESLDIMGGDTGTSGMDVTLQADQFHCGEETDLPVEVSATGADGVVANLDTGELVFTVSPGIYDSSVTQAYEGTQSVSIEVQAPSGTTSDFSTQVGLEASFGGANPATCGPNELPPADDIAPLSVNVQADQEPTTDDGESPNGDDGSSGGGDDGEEGNGIPFPAWTVPAAALSAALATRRRS